MVRPGKGIEPLFLTHEVKVLPFKLSWRWFNIDNRKPNFVTYTNNTYR